MSLPINFRRDLAGKVYQLTQYNPLTPLVDKQYDVQKLNERFIKVNNAVRVCFDAISDLATRDPSFLPAFFQGFVNPVYVRTTKYANLEMHKFIEGFNSNGTPVSFTEPMTVYSYPDLGDITTEDYECLLFKNGELMEADHYVVSNTAFGLKAFVKSSRITANDDVTIAVHRVYNRQYQMYKHPVQTATTSFDEIIDVPSHFPNFYSADYLQVAVRASGASFYKVISPELYEVVYDSANQKVRVVALDLALSKFDTVIVYDTTSFFRQSYTGANIGGARVVIPSIPLTQTIPGTNEKVPVAFRHAKDFDIWLNGRHLVPGKHYVVTHGFAHGNENENRIEFLIEQPTNSVYRIDVIKNVPFMESNTTYVYRDNLDRSGVELVGNTRFPIMKGMGECYINGRFIEPEKIGTVHKDVMTIDGVTERYEFLYKFNPPINEATLRTIGDALNASTEFDKFVNLIGGVSELVKRTRDQRPELPVVMRPDLVDSYTGTALPIITSYIRYAMADIPDITRFQLDSNAPLLDNLWDFSFWDTQLLTNVIIDSNRTLTQEVVIDCNYANDRLENATAGRIAAMAPIISNYTAYALSATANLTGFQADSNVPLINDLFGLVEWNYPEVDAVVLDGNERLTANTSLDSNG
jgi:hypothetical protein